ncbi:unnamed protein product [Prorocentrum cordatum]|uniref:Uncharacterized protein n=1 Tax=Prorocentrum cordatum TaxID=2364126 RepID=A0ABN9TMQ2_9DINO|nr:unnamed protein product [Polarella glacialis]
MNTESLSTYRGARHHCIEQGTRQEAAGAATGLRPKSDMPSRCSRAGCAVRHRRGRGKEKQADDTAGKEQEERKEMNERRAAAACSSRVGLLHMRGKLASAEKRGALHCVATSPEKDVLMSTGRVIPKCSNSKRVHID